MCQADEKWTETLPIVLGIRTAYKEDLKSSVAEFVYGEPLRVPGELPVPAAPKVEASGFIQQLRRHIEQLRPTPAARHSSPSTFVHKDLRDSTHVFLRQDATPRLGAAIQWPALTKHLKLSYGAGRSLSADRVKPAYLLGLKTTPATRQSCPAARQPSPAALQQSQIKHGLILQRLHALGALYASRHVSSPKPSSPQGEKTPT